LGDEKHLLQTKRAFSLMLLSIYLFLSLEFILQTEGYD